LKRACGFIRSLLRSAGKGPRMKLEITSQTFCIVATAVVLLLAGFVMSLRSLGGPVEFAMLSPVEQSTIVAVGQGTAIAVGRLCRWAV
jgi:hypothetical protein